MSETIGTNETILVSITTTVNSFVTERRFALNLTIGELKEKLELITGASNESMKIQVLDTNNEFVTELDDNRRQLKSYLSDNQNKLNVHVIDSTHSAGEFEDLSRVPKFELPQEDYENRSESLLAFKQKNKLGRFRRTDQTDGTDHKDSQSETECHLQVGQRCEVCVKGLPKRRATVMFVGTTRFKSGLWVGVRYDEPFGKNDGSVDGVKYFECKPKYGGFVRPDSVTVGQFGELGVDSDEELK